jgi:hypothetical protein
MKRPWQPSRRRVNPEPPRTTIDNFLESPAAAHQAGWYPDPLDSQRCAIGMGQLVRGSSPASPNCHVTDSELTDQLLPFPPQICRGGVLAALTLPVLLYKKVVSGPPSPGTAPTQPVPGGRWAGRRPHKSLTNMPRTNHSRQPRQAIGAHPESRTHSGRSCWCQRLITGVCNRAGHRLGKRPDCRPTRWSS